MPEVIECVANFSEGRDANTIAALQAAIRSVDSAHLLDTHVDTDHNRCVLTFIAPPSDNKRSGFSRHHRCLRTNRYAPTPRRTPSHRRR